MDNATIIYYAHRAHLLRLTYFLGIAVERRASAKEICGQIIEVAGVNPSATVKVHYRCIRGRRSIGKHPGSHIDEVIDIRPGAVPVDVAAYRGLTPDTRAQ